MRNGFSRLLSLLTIIATLCTGLSFAEMVPDGTEVIEETVPEIAVPLEDPEATQEPGGEPSETGLPSPEETPIPETTPEPEETPIAEMTPVPAAKMYSITYVLNGGTNNIGNPVGYDRGETVKFLAPVREGYTFAGWFTSKKFKTSFPGIKSSMTGNKTVYAKWTANKYTVVFSPNGAAGKKSYKQAFSYNKEAKLAKSEFTPKGLTQTGWNTEPDGSGTAYKLNQKVKNITTVAGGKVTLYAQWKPKEYKISYKLSGGTNNTANPATYTTLENTTFAPAERMGYSFGGWYSDSKFKKKTSGIKAGATGNKTVYAKWIPYSLNIIFHANNGTQSTMTQAFKSGSALKANKFKLTNYRFLRWTTEADGSGLRFTNKQTVSEHPFANGSTIHLYAQWGPNMTTINYRGTEYRVVNTPIDVVTFSNLTYHKICQSPNDREYNQYPGKCLNFCFYHCACLVNGIGNLSVKNGAKGKHYGCEFDEKKFSKLPGMMSKLYSVLNKGKPQIMMVQAKAHASRHFVTVVGYKASVTCAEDLKPEDLLILDSDDGQLEAMDPEIFSEHTRVLYKEEGKYRLEVLV